MEIQFPNGRRADVIKPQLGTTAREIIDQLDCQPPTLITLVGGAGGLSPDDLARLLPLFEGALVPAAQTMEAVVLDGGTDVGVMRLMGQARTAREGTFPLIGVAVDRTVILPGEDAPRPDAAPLEPNHTHFVLVPGEDWGDESLWLNQISEEVGKSVPTVTILINGGEIARRDVAFTLAAGQPVLVLAGSGRLADELAASVDQYAGVHVVDVNDGPDRLRDVIISLLKGDSDG
jgi:hypothetical protein